MSMAPHAISLLVHERADVVVDQCRNFETFAPASLVMIHVSATATFTRASLETALREAGLTRSIVNPVSRASAWGSILLGHFENIRALGGLLADGAAVSLHASNDLLLQPLPHGPELSVPRYENRPISTRSLWFTGRQFAKSAAFAELSAALGCPRSAGSQIEGSVYPHALLSELVDVAAPLEARFADLPFAAEEVVFPSWAVSRLGPSGRFPYILFRQPLAPAAAVALMPAPMRGTRLSDRLQSGVNRIATTFGSADGRPADVEAIIAGEPLSIAGWAQGGASRGREHFLGIKRIARNMDDPIRQRIVRHSSAHRGAADGALSPVASIDGVI